MWSNWVGKVGGMPAALTTLSVSTSAPSHSKKATVFCAPISKK